MQGEVVIEDTGVKTAVEGALWIGSLKTRKSVPDITTTI
jgi:hypothetical protein